MLKRNYKGMYFNGRHTREHVLIAEKALGHRLPAGAQVHHRDGDRGNNAPPNLIICQDQAYHYLLHAREKAYRATGNPNKRCCLICKEWDLPSEKFKNYRSERPSGQWFHKTCNAALARKRNA